MIDPTQTVDVRYPYTYACDYIRNFGGIDSGGVRTSRADASQIRQAIAKALDIPDEELAKKLADYFKLNQDELAKEAADKIISAIRS